MKKFFITVALILTTITGLFAEEKKWNVEYYIRTVTTDELYSTVKLNPYWQEYEWWICEEDDDGVVQHMYMDPYWDNDEAKTVMQKISQEEESIEKEKDYTKEVYVYVDISYGDSFSDQMNTRRVFIMNLKTYEMWEFCFSEAALAFQKRHSVERIEKE